MYKVIVAGSREFNDYDLLQEKLKLFLKGKYPKEVEIVSGGARGADKLGEVFAKQYRCNLQVIPAKWNEHGRSAGYLRNAEMAQYSDACIVFWDGISRGTKHMIDLAEKAGLRLEIVRV